MIISSTPISANEALKNNLVSEVYDNNELITQAKKFLLIKQWKKHRIFIKIIRQKKLKKTSLNLQ